MELTKRHYNMENLKNYESINNKDTIHVYYIINKLHNYK